MPQLCDLAAAWTNRSSELIVWQVNELLSKWPEITSDVYNGRTTLMLAPPECRLKERTAEEKTSGAIIRSRTSSFDSSSPASAALAAAPYSPSTSIFGGSQDAPPSVAKNVEEAGSNPSSRSSAFKQKSMFAFTRPAPHSAASSTVLNGSKRKAQGLVAGNKRPLDDSDNDGSNSDVGDAKMAAPMIRKRLKGEVRFALPMMEYLLMDHTEYLTKHASAAIPRFRTLMAACIKNPMAGDDAFLILVLLIKLAKAVPYRNEPGKGTPCDEIKYCFVWIMCRLRCLHERNLIKRFSHYKSLGISWTWTEACVQMPFANAVLDMLCNSLEKAIAELKSVPVKLDKIETEYSTVEVEDQADQEADDDDGDDDDECDGPPKKEKEEKSKKNILPLQWSFNLNTAVQNFLKALHKVLLASILTSESKHNVVVTATEKKLENDESFYKTSFKFAVMDWITLHDPECTDMSRDEVEQNGGEEFYRHFSVLMVMSKNSKDKVPASPPLKVREPVNFRCLFVAPVPKVVKTAEDPPLKKGKAVSTVTVLRLCC